MQNRIKCNIVWWVLALAPACALSIGGCPTGQTEPPNGNANSNGNDNGATQPLDSDGDGVADPDDDCADTPTGAAVDGDGCAPSQLDSDNDGVTDDQDNCPNTPPSAAVGADGCETVVVPDPDADGDGVADAQDECADTPVGAAVDADGCAPSQLDSDGDGVTDDLDDCADTPDTVDIDDDGCPVGDPDAPDADGDGVGDDIDQCADTPAEAGVDANGCATSQLDSDGDGVTDDVDECADTPGETDVDDTGCPENDEDSDGVPDTIDLCARTPSSETANSDGCSPSQLTDGGGGGGSPGSVVCGNSVVETGEACDPPDGDTCDANCQTITAGGLANDSCESPIAIGEGIRSFSNVDATTDGPDEPGRCAEFGYTQIDADIWYLYTATCTDTVIASICCSVHDTKMAVYSGSGCPQTPLISCSDDDCGTGTGSRVTFPAVAGESYMIRIGGFEGAQGIGEMNIYCSSSLDFGTNSCGAGAGACFTDDETQQGNGTPGCENEDTCNAVCAVDACCCDGSWDGLCGQKAAGIVQGFDSCVPESGACSAGKDTPGCEDTECCNDVCAADPFCCLTEWDGFCAEAIESACGVFQVCETAVGSCFTENVTAGCDNRDCCNLVCEADGVCCAAAGEWDSICVERAVELCR